MCEEKLAGFEEFNLKHDCVTTQGEHFKRTREITGKNKPNSYREDYYPSKNIFTKPARTLMLPSKQVMYLVDKLLKLLLL